MATFRTLEAKKKTEHPSDVYERKAASAVQSKGRESVRNPSDVKNEKDTDSDAHARKAKNSAIERMQQH